MRIKAEMVFPAGLKDEPIICHLCKNFNLTLSIIEASFSTDTGWAILVLEASKEELQKALEYLKNKGVGIEDSQELP